MWAVTPSLLGKSQNQVTHSCSCLLLRTLVRNVPASQWRPHPPGPPLVSRSCWITREADRKALQSDLGRRAAQLGTGFCNQKTSWISLFFIISSVEQYTSSWKLKPSKGDVGLNSGR